MTDDMNKNDRKTKSSPKSMDDNQQWWLKSVPNCNRWSDVNISRFLRLYKSYPVLWDPTHLLYKDQPSRMKAYSMIASRLNLCGIKESECIQLVESLKDLHAKERKRQTIAKSCSQKYTHSPVWYHMLEKLIECVQQKLANSARKVKVEPAEPWEACCPRLLYTEDIWTPEHFKTNVMDWFITPQDEQLLCTCEQFSETTLDNICSTETSSTYCGCSTNDSGGEIDQCTADKPSDTSKTCCCDTQNNNSLEQCRVDVNNDEMRRHDDRKLKKKGRMSSFCESYTVNDTKICGDDKRPERMDDGLENIAQKRLEKNKQQIRKKKLVLCKNSEARATVCTEDHDLLDICGNEAVEKLQDGICTCPWNNISFSENTSLSQETCDVKYQNGFSYCGDKLNELRPCDYQSTTEKPSPNEAALKSYSDRIFNPCGTTPENSGSLVSSKSEISPSPTQSHDTCSSDSNAVAGMASSNSSHSSLLLPEHKSVSETVESDHRLDYHPDPTLCQKCAVDRVPVREVCKNIVHFQDPRMPELDKYCRYKDWDAIYNIRTQVPDEEPVFQMDEDLLLMMRYQNEPPRPKRQNHFTTEADMNIFRDSKSSEGRQVSLNNEYKREYGLDIEIHQPRHYACEVSEASGLQPAQLIL